MNRELRQLTGETRSSTLVQRSPRDAGRRVAPLEGHGRWVSPLDGCASWSDVGADYKRTINKLLGRAINVGISSRQHWELLTTIDAVHPLS